MKYENSFGSVCGMASIGPRGQLVIPKEAREQLKMREGDRFLVIEHFGKLIFIPEKIMKTFLKDLTKKLK